MVFNSPGEVLKVRASVQAAPLSDCKALQHNPNRAAFPSLPNSDSGDILPSFLLPAWASHGLPATGYQLVDRWHGMAQTIYDSRVCVELSCAIGLWNVNCLPVYPALSESASPMKLLNRFACLASAGLACILSAGFGDGTFTAHVSAAEVILADQIAALQSPEQLSREMALVRMAQMGGHARDGIAAIVLVLKDPTEGVRMAAAQTLGRLGNPSDVSGPALFAALDDPAVSVRVAAIGSLRHLDYDKSAVVKKLIEMANHDAWPQKVAVADGLSMARELKEQPELELAAATTLLKLLTEPYVLVRSAAARSLGGLKSGADASVPALILAASDVDWRVRRDTAGALGAFGEQAASASDVLVKLLRDSDQETRLRAGQSLRSVNPAGAFDLLMAAAKDGNENVRYTAIESLGRYGSTEPVIAALAAALSDGSADVRYRAVRALEAMGPAALPALDVLTKSVNDRNCLVRETTCRAIGRLGPAAAAAVPVLLVASTDDWHGGTRKSAAAALKAIAPLPAPAP